MDSNGMGWVPLLLGMLLMPCWLMWRRRYRGRWWAAVLFTLLALLFLDTLMGWAAWYK